MQTFTRGYSPIFTNIFHLPGSAKLPGLQQLLRVPKRGLRRLHGDPEGLEAHDVGPPAAQRQLTRQRQRRGEVTHAVGEDEDGNAGHGGDLVGGKTLGKWWLRFVRVIVD